MIKIQMKKPSLRTAVIPHITAVLLWCSRKYVEAGFFCNGSFLRKNNRNTNNHTDAEKDYNIKKHQKNCLK